MRVPASYAGARTSDLDVKMTPMIDVVFLLLIFFVWTASFRLAEFDLPSRLSTPSGQGAETIAEIVDFEHVSIRIFWQQAAPSWQINGRMIASIGEIRDTLRGVAGISTDLPVILDPEAAVPLGHVIDVYDLARVAGFTRVQFVAFEGP